MDAYDVWLLWFSVGSAFLFGSLFGSFLNVVVYRMPLDRSVVFPPSACTTCGNPLSTGENIPILGYFLLGGRCRTCASPYSMRYALVELFMALWAAGLVWFFGGVCFQVFYVYALIFVSTAVFLTDVDHWIIPDQLNLAGVLIGLGGSYWMPLRDDLPFLSDWGLAAGVSNLLSSLAGIVFGVGFFWMIQVVGTLWARQEAMGGGDVKFAAAIGAFLGWKLGFFAFLLSFVLGAGVVVPVLLVMRGRGKDPIPFGTFMAVAACFVALWGGRLEGWLTRLSDWLYGGL